MKTYPTVEDYLEVLAGMRDIVTGKTVSSWFLGFSPIISLARYDVDVLTSMSDATSQGKALTEKQGELLCKILLKYKRQLATKSIDVDPVEKPVWRVPLRKMDYTQSLSIENDKIILKFPYNTKLIESLREFKNASQGRCYFDNDAKVWNIALTEFNINWTHTWAKTNGFQIDPEVERLNNIVLAVEAIPHAIELVYDTNGLDISNCPDSLREYVEEKLGGFGHNNLLKLVDYAGVLGYTINSDLENALIQEYGPRFLTLAKNREVKINPQSKVASDDFFSVVEYAVKVDRLPVIIFEPDLSGKLLQRLKEVSSENDILEVKNGKIADVNPGHKFIYTIKPVANLEKIPLLISSAGMIFGSTKSVMVQQAEKIVYVAADVYQSQNSQKFKKVFNL